MKGSASVLFVGTVRSNGKYLGGLRSLLVRYKNNRSVLASGLNDPQSTVDLLVQRSTFRGTFVLLSVDFNVG